MASLSSKNRTRKSEAHLAAPPSSGYLLHAKDSGNPVIYDPIRGLGLSRGRGGDDWGTHLDSFRLRNRSAFEKISITDRITSTRDGMRLELYPGLRIGAVPIISHLSNKISGGIIVEPRFGWSGVGKVLSATGWSAAPEFLSLPLVPGSGREIPPWVLAGPVVQRIAVLLQHLRPGYYEKTEVRTSPRGHIRWNSYIQTQITSGKWHLLPCQFTELETDSRLRQAIRWVLEHLRNSLKQVGTGDSISATLITQITLLLETLTDIAAKRPRSGELERSGLGRFESKAVVEGLQAINWIVDERGLGGGQTYDGLAWMLQLDKLWERYVEGVIRKEAMMTGGRVKSGRLGETTVPLAWSDRRHALSHLVPDLVVHRADSIEIVDAKYKSHFADLNLSRWSELNEEVQDSVRADIHQILAYVATEGASKPIKATLMYPVYRSTYDELAEYKKEVVSANIQAGSQNITLQMRAIPFGL